jgi:aldehyde dehydrogenase (NAD+)
MSDSTALADAERTSSDGAPLRLDHWIGGRRVAPASREYLDRYSPVDHQLVSRVARGTGADVAAAVAAADRARIEWSRTAPIARGRLLLSLAATIREHAASLAALERRETGKPERLAATEIEGVAAYFEFYGTLVNLPAGDVLDLGPRFHVYTRREPFGIVGVITPWNVPLGQVARAVAPAIAAGNVVVVKPSEFTSASTVRLGELAQEAGLPDGVLNVVLGNGSEAGAALVEHEQIRKLAFTGSVAAGRTIGHVAADRILPLTLELGGKSANVVFADANLERAARTSVTAYTANSGQVCSAGTRLLVQRSVHDEFVERLVELTERLDLRSQVGPLITDAQRDQVIEYFDVAASEGLRPRTGGSPEVPDPDLAVGNYLSPTIYAGASNDMRIAREEIFGPVVVVIPFDDEDDAIALANDSPYGLVAGVWTEDIGRAFRVAGSLEVGQVFVNTWTTGAVETPFGGFKLSGYGREKGIESLHQYQQLKTVTVSVADDDQQHETRP